ncbi:MAG: hypothetical protein ACRC6N_11235 [Plesiomonas sp.]|uniref:hypothetical protein n=1 Tax=Plesiomonas sp. TaxID=2486279 RepID=UPI003F326932
MRKTISTLTIASLAAFSVSAEQNSACLSNTVNQFDVLNGELCAYNTTYSAVADYMGFVVETAVPVTHKMVVATAINKSTNESVIIASTLQMTKAVISTNENADPALNVSNMRDISYQNGYFYFLSDAWNATDAIRRISYNNLAQCFNDSVIPSQCHTELFTSGLGYDFSRANGKIVMRVKKWILDPNGSHSKIVFVDLNTGEEIEESS